LGIKKDRRLKRKIRDGWAHKNPDAEKPAFSCNAVAEERVTLTAGSN
jgi:hypothetical protein